MWIENSELKILVTYLENITTHQIHLDLKNKKGNLQDFEVTQVMDESLEIRAPKGACVDGHQLDLMIQAVSSDDSWPVHSRAKVKGVVESDESHILVNAELHNVHDIDFERFKEALENRQAQVEKLFKAVKGSD